MARTLASIVLFSVLLFANEAVGQQYAKGYISSVISAAYGNWTSYFGPSLTYKKTSISVTSSTSSAITPILLNGTALYAVLDPPAATADYPTALAPFVRLPIGAFALAIVYNIPSTNITGRLNLTAPLLARIYQENITQWSDPDLLAINPNLAYNKPITPVGRWDSSAQSSLLGTYLAASTGALWTLGKSSSLVFPPGVAVGNGTAAVGSIINNVIGSIGM